jgi:hypothetical protein
LPAQRENEIPRLIKRTENRGKSHQKGVGEFRFLANHGRCRELDDSDGVVPDFLQLDAGLMQQLVELSDAGIGIPVSFIGKPAAHFLNHDHQVG